MSARPAARPTRRSARTRERIIEAATEVFARRGVHGTRVADIAERAGVAYGLVYHHFRNKEEILTAIFAERWAQYVAYLEELARMLGGVEVTAKAREHARDMLAAATQPPGKKGGTARRAAAAPDDPGDTVRQPRPPLAREQ